VRVAFVAPLVTAIREPQVGGSQALLADIARGLTERGHDVVVFAASGSQIEGAEVVDTGVDAETLTPALFRESSDVPATREAVDAFARTYDLVRGEPFDVVHNHAFDVPAIELADVDAPVVHTLHLPPRPSIAAALSNAAGRVTIATVSHWSARAWGSVIDTILPNGVPVERIGYSAGPGNGALFAGRISREKGVREAIEIARAADVPLTVVGPRYDNDYAEVIEREVAVLPAVSRAELWALMASAEAVLAPVLWDEPFGLVAAEAQAAGTPVIAFDRGALPEVVLHDETGMLVDDVDAGAQALGRIGDIDRGRCRHHAEEDLSLERTLDAHEALYAKLVS
jgi:UDP-glucose:tetrahydrobiopterin glucosyltransferase